MISETKDITGAVKALYPETDWDRFEDINRAMNMELMYGPFGRDYWHDVDPLENYDWDGFSKAASDLKQMLDDLPWTLYYEEDSGVLSETDPEDIEDNWMVVDEESGEAIWAGGEWYIVHPAEYIVAKEVYRYVV